MIFNNNDGKGNLSTDEIDARLTGIKDETLSKKARSTGERVKEIYENLEGNIEALLNLNMFDAVRQLQYLASHEQIKKIKDPAEQAQKFSQLYSSIQRDMILLLGINDPRVEEGLTPEQLMQMAMNYGAEHFYG